MRPELIAHGVFCAIGGKPTDNGAFAGLPVPKRGSLGRRWGGAIPKSARLMPSSAGVAGSRTGSVGLDWRRALSEMCADARKYVESRPLESVLCSRQKVAAAPIAKPERGDLHGCVPRDQQPDELRQLTHRSHREIPLHFVAAGRQTTRPGVFAAPKQSLGRARRRRGRGAVRLPDIRTPQRRVRRSN